MHELNKFQEWVEKTNNYGENSSNSLRYHCEKIIYWANRVKEIDKELYSIEVKEKEEDTVKKCLSTIYDEYLKYLYEANEHGEYTKIKQTKIMRFIYNFNTYFGSILNHLNDQFYIEDAINRIQDRYIHNIFYDLRNVEEYQMDSLLSFINLGLKSGVQWEEFRALVERAIISKKDSNIVSDDLEGESDEVDYKVQIPDAKKNS